MKRLVLNYGFRCGDEVSLEIGGSMALMTELKPYRDDKTVFSDIWRREESYFRWDSPSKTDKAGSKKRSFDRSASVGLALHLTMACCLVAMSVSIAAGYYILCVPMIFGVCVAYITEMTLRGSESEESQKLRSCCQDTDREDGGALIPLDFVCMRKYTGRRMRNPQYIFCGYTATSSPLLQKLEEAYEVAAKIHMETDVSCNLWLDIADCPLAVEIMADFYRQLGTIEQDKCTGRATEVIASLPLDAQEALANACANAAVQVLSAIHEKECAAKEAEELAKIKHQLRLDSDVDKLTWSALGYVPYSAPDRQS